MKIMYLNFDKLTLSQLFSMVFDNKLKINLYHEHFPDTLEKYTRFPKFILLFSNSYVRINRKVIWVKFTAAFFLSSLFALLQSLNRFLF